MNRLSSEKSPYLLQHARNPVNWYPWGEQALAAARREDKPIFLSVGYSTCHWCHVMAHESFENPEIAAILNEQFICVKVDREERPDVDRVYMAFVQATTGSGGWPMSVWLLPDGRPFYGGTYFPPRSQWGRPGFADLLRELARLWREERGRVERAAEGVMEQLGAVGEAAVGPGVPGAEALDAAREDLLASHDRRHGGFGGAPKFPRPSELLFLLREHRRTGDEAALDAVVRTLAAMSAGGMRDHVGGGFHRYSVDAEWRVPHFEKMLYDQAQLVLALLEAGQATGDGRFFDVAADTLDYVRREMTAPEGGFYSAEDADSVPAGAPAGAHALEGAFYLWSAEELERALGPDARVFCERYGVRPGGNAPADPQGEFSGRNILYEARPVGEVAVECGLSVEEAEAALRRSRDILRRLRAERPRPLRDDKILTAWNGLMIAAFARASRILQGQDRSLASGDLAILRSGDLTDASTALRTIARSQDGEIAGVGRAFSPADAGSFVGRGFPGLSGVEGSPACLDMARRAAAFIRSRMREPTTGRLLRRFRDGEAAIDAYAEDYAYLVFGLLELFQADGDPEWLSWALDLQRRQDELFWDEARGGWFSTTGLDGTVLLRLKEDYDGAEPSAGSVSVFNLLTLSHLGALPGDTSAQVERAFGAFASRLEGAPRAVPMMLAAASAWHAGMAEVVIVGPRDDAATLGLLRAVERSFQPFVVLLRVDPGSAEAARLVELLPWLSGYGMRGGRPTAYVCRNFACEAPMTDAGELEARLRQAGS